MIRVFVTLVCLVGICISITPTTAGEDNQDAAKSLPGWPDLFVTLFGYSRQCKSPVVGPGNTPLTYQQQTRYDWMGGRFEQLDITFARDPAFKDLYAAETVKKDKTPPREVHVGQKQAWLWEFPDRKYNEVSKRLVVVLDADKAIIIEQRGYGLKLQEEVAALLDLAKIEKALATPPAK